MSRSGGAASVRRSVHDPRRLELLKQNRALPCCKVVDGFLSSGSGRRKELRALEPVPEDSASVAGYSVRESDLAPHELALYRNEPWRSPAVAALALKLGNKESGCRAVEPMMLQGPRGTALRAIGEKEDHNVASHTVAQIERRRLRAANASLQGGTSPSQALLKHLRAEGGGELIGRAQSGAPPTFGAVYEYQDSCGTAKIIASTGVLPERQFLLDKRQHSVLRAAPDPSLVWVGVSGGAGGLGEAQMAEVRQAVASARADRLQARKLADIKPYSRHG